MTIAYSLTRLDSRAYRSRLRTRISVLPAPDDPFIHPRVAERTKLCPSHNCPAPEAVTSARVDVRPTGAQAFRAFLRHRSTRTEGGLHAVIGTGLDKRRRVSASSGRTLQPAPPNCHGALTRSRTRQPGNISSSLSACYYTQRASSALIISEATQVSQQSQGYAWTPGIHIPEQEAPSARHRSREPSLGFRPRRRQPVTHRSL